MMQWIGAAVSCSHENRLLVGSGTGGKHEQKVRSKENRKTAVWGNCLHLRRCHELHMLNVESQFIYGDSPSLPAYLQNSLTGMACMKQSCEFLHAVFKRKREITVRKFPNKVETSSEVIKYKRRLEFDVILIFIDHYRSGGDPIRGSSPDGPGMGPTQPHIQWVAGFIPRR
jgi:hypothetical protein